MGTQGTAGARRRGKDMHHMTFPLQRVMGAAPWDGNTTIRVPHAWLKDQSAGAETHKQPKPIQPPCLALPPLSNMSSSISFPALATLGCSSPLPPSLWRFCPSPCSCLLPTLHLHRAACTRKREGQRPETSS